MMTTKKQQKIGNIINIILWINIILIGCYLVYNIIFFPKITEGLMTFLPRKPFYLRIIKDLYAIFMVLGIILLQKEINISWVIINLSSVGILSIWIFSFGWYTSISDVVLLELIAVSLIIITNNRYFVLINNIQRTFARTVLIFVIPMLISNVLIIINFYVYGR